MSARCGAIDALLPLGSSLTCGGQEVHLGAKPGTRTGEGLADRREAPIAMRGSSRTVAAAAVPSTAQRLAGEQIHELEAGRYSGSAAIAVVEATDPGLGHDPSLARWLYLARTGSVAVEGLVGPRVVVIREVLT